MLVKFFKTKNGGSIAGINYLLNHRIKDNTAFVLKGSEVVTRTTELVSRKNIAS